MEMIMSDKLTPTNLQRANAAALLEYQHGYLWGDPGTGKTLTSIVAIEEGGFDRAVVVGPVLSLGMWADSFLTQLGWDTLIIRSGKLTKDQVKRLADGAYKAIVTTFALSTNTSVRLILQNFLEQGAQSVLVIDEAHYCKNRLAKRTIALLSKPTAPRVRRLNRPGLPSEVITPGNGVFGKGIGCYANSVWQLTGTPITRWPDDLYAQLAFGRSEVLNAYGVNTYAAFIRKFCVLKEMRVSPTRTVTTVAGSKNLDVLNQMVKDCRVIRCTLKEAAAELPPLTQRTLEAELKKHGKIDLGKLSDAELVKELAKPASPYGVAWHDLGMDKAASAVEYIAEIARREPVLVGVWHISVGKLLTKLLSGLGFKVAFVSGAVSGVQRDLIRDDFNAGKLDVIVGQMAAMNTSWNLQECGAYVVVLEQHPSPGVVTQFVHRVYRKGQSNHVQVDYIMTDHQLDKAISRIRAEKGRQTAEVLSGI